MREKAYFVGKLKKFEAIKMEGKKYIDLFGLYTSFYPDFVRVI